MRPKNNNYQVCGKVQKSLAKEVCCSKHTETSKVQKSIKTTGTAHQQERSKSRSPAQGPNRLQAKLIYLSTTASIALLTSCLFHLRWLAPYYYVTMAPVLLAIRVRYYWKTNKQYFLIDFCYFCNIGTYLYLWGFPQSHGYFCILFSTTTGPLLWSVGLFRNSLTFHNLDKLTSVFKHFVPALVIFCIRWYPHATSQRWYTTFVRDYHMTWNDSIIWLALLPYAAFVTHSLSYNFFVYVLMRPDEKYLHLYRYVCAKTVFTPLAKKYGYESVLLFALYHVIYWGYGACSLALAVVCYHSFTAHVTCVVLVCLIGVWNGASYHVEVFGVKSFSSM